MKKRYVVFLTLVATELVVRAIMGISGGATNSDYADLVLGVLMLVWSGLMYNKKMYDKYFKLQD